MIEQDGIAATVYVRVGGDWKVHVLLEDAILSMPEIGTEVPLKEFYEGIDLGVPEDVEEVPHPE